MAPRAALPTDYEVFALAGEKPRGRAVIKQSIEDFQVDEVLGFPLRGAGSHLWLHVRKQDISTSDVARLLADRFGTPLSDVGYSGMKDRRGICTQWFSVPEKDVGPADISQVENERVNVLGVLKNDRKLKIGTHRANAFRIRLRAVSTDRAELEARCLALSRRGVPNYFGPQRLGRGLANVHQAQEAFGSAVAPGKLARSGRFRKGMLLSAARSFLFNRILSRRVAEGSWDRMLPGEVLNLDGTKRFFHPGPGLSSGVGPGEEDAHATLLARLERCDVHPTGLLYGRVGPRDKYVAGAQVAILESDTLSDYPVLCQGLLANGLVAGRRPLRLLPRDLTIAWIDQESVELRFVLSAGGYATSVLRELVELPEQELIATGANEEQENN